MTHQLEKKYLFALRFMFNDQQVSFFTMYSNVLHGGVTLPSDGFPATFIVIESLEIKRS
jgi:hypothetical protein